MRRSGSRAAIVAASLVVSVLLVLAGCSSSTSSSPSASSSKAVRIGLEAPLTGEQKDVGAGMLAGAQFAADELNATGGINGRKVEIVPIDDAADPDIGVAAARAAIAAGLDAIVGPYNSGVGAKTLPLYVDAGLVPLRLTSADSTQGLGFTLQPMTSQIAPVATAAITTWVGAATVAIIHDDTQTYTKDADAAMKASLAAAGVTVTTDIPITPGAPAYADAVTSALATSPQLVYVITYYPEAGSIAKSMLAGGGATRCLADYGAYDSGYIAAAGIPAAQRCPVVGVPAPGDFPEGAADVAAYRARFGTDPGTWAPYTHDSVTVLAQAARTAGSFETAALTSALQGITGWSGWTGKVSFAATTGNRMPAPVVVATTTPDGTLHIDPTWVAATGFAF